MLILKKVFFVTIIIITISFNICYAIDENQLSSGTDYSANSYVDDTGITPTQSFENNVPDESTSSTDENVNESSYAGSSATPSLDSISSDDSESQSSTRVSSTSSSSTITNIINIGLLVVGLLLIFLAIAILIKLNS